MKYYFMFTFYNVVLSPSLRGRGLKSSLEIYIATLLTSPSLRGRGLKLSGCPLTAAPQPVALFTRAWIEIPRIMPFFAYQVVALFTRAWIEIFLCKNMTFRTWVALFTRAWIEIPPYKPLSTLKFRRPLYEGVD